MIDPIFTSAVTEHIRNTLVKTGIPYPDALNAIMGPDDIRNAQAEISSWDGYAPTPLHNLSPLAKALRAGWVTYKDEGGRFGLGSFKALGGAYAVFLLLQREKATQSPGDITVVTATDGNHGRSVAWGAQRFGCNCRIYIHSGVSENRKKAMEDLGATVIRINGNYDASVHQAAKDADANGWFVVSDTSWDGYRDVPKDVMAGYSVMAIEAIEQIAEQNLPTPTHVFVQGGVGGLAAAVLAVFWQHYGANCPRFVVVEPDRAACLFESATVGEACIVNITEETLMAGLSCGEISDIAWEILAEGATNFMTIPDAIVAPAMDALGRGKWAETAVIAGESAVAGLAGVVAAFQHPDTRMHLGLDLTGSSHILTFGTEGATDPTIYEQLVPGVLAFAR